MCRVSVTTYIVLSSIFVILHFSSASAQAAKEGGNRGLEYCEKKKAVVFCFHLAMATDNVRHDSSTLRDIGQIIANRSSRSWKKTKVKVLTAGAKQALEILLKNQKSNFPTTQRSCWRWWTPLFSTRPCRKPTEEAHLRELLDYAQKHSQRSKEASVERVIPCPIACFHRLAK